jgi:hypothetical protein
VEHCGTWDRSLISHTEHRKTQRIGFSPMFEAIEARKTAPDAGPRAALIRTLIFSTGSGGFRTRQCETACE